MRRFATISLTLSLLLGLTTVGRLLAQDEKEKKEPAKAEAASSDSKKEDSKTDDSKKDESKKDESKKDESKKDAGSPPSKGDSTKSAAAPAQEPQPTIPPDVEEKLERARRAVAEAIVAAQDAGLVQTSIDPPPILDILITGRANDEAQLKRATEQKDLQVGVSPEVFGAWFTGYAKPEMKDRVNPQNQVRITQPSKGLKDWYDQRAAILRKHMDEVRKAQGTGAAESKDQTKPGESKKDESKKDESKKDDSKKDESKADESKKDETKAKTKDQAK